MYKLSNFRVGGKVVEEFLWSRKADFLNLFHHFISFLDLGGVLLLMFGKHLGLIRRALICLRYWCTINQTNKQTNKYQQYKILKS